MPTTSNFGWTTPADTDLVKDGAAAIRTLGNGIDTSLVDLKGGTTNQVLAKNSNTDLDFKWVADASGIPATIFDAKGDIIAATAADTADRLAVGTNGQVLTADSTASTGLKWSTPVSGSLTLLSTTATTSGTSIDIASISQDYKKLRFVGQGINRTNTASFRIKFYNNTTELSSTYCIQWGTNTAEGYPYDMLYPDNNNGQVGTTAPMNFVLEIDNYADTFTDSYKPFNFYGMYYNTSYARVVGFRADGTMKNNGAAINKVNFYSDYAFNAGQILTYGVN